MKKANLLGYTLVSGILTLIAFFKGQRYIRKAKIKGPAITLSNHTSFADFLYTTAAPYPHRLNYLAAKKFFYQSPLGPLLRAAQAIPKALLEADPSATKKALQVIKNKGVLSIFPEGQISLTGVSLRPSYSISKLIKKAGVPLYIIKHYNASLVNPAWNNLTYKGRILTDSYLLLTPEEIASKSEDEIYKIVVNALSFNPYLYNKEMKYKYKEKPLTNLDYILYECPTCLKEGLKVEHRTLVCPHCQARLTMDRYWQFPNTNIHELFLNQQERMKEKYLNDNNYALSSFVKLESFRGKKIETVGEGQFSLGKDGYQFVGKIDGEEKELTFDPALVSNLPHDTGKNVQIYQHGQLYQFVFASPYEPIKFIMLGEILHSLTLG